MSGADPVTRAGNTDTSPAAGDADPFAALASPVRRRLLDLLRQGPRPVGALAAEFAMARPSVSEHLRVLRAAGLVTQVRSGRQQVYDLRAEPLAEVQEWLNPYERFWRGRLRALREVLDAQPDEPPRRARGGQPGPDEAR